MDKSSESSIARKALRQQLLTLRSDMAQAGRVHLDTLLCQQLLGADLLQSADNIGVYLPIRSEPDLSACYAQWRAQGRRLAVATGKSRAGLDRVLAGGELGAFFEATRCAEEGASKPDPWMLQSLAEEIDVSPTQMVMVGDSIYDIEMARAFGCASIGVYYDTGTPLMLQSSEPDAMAATVVELGRLLGCA